MTKDYKHATRSPSGAYRWINCGGSIFATRNFIEESSESADEGTCAHHVLEECIQSGLASPKVYLGKKIATYDDDNKIRNEFTIDQDMVDGVEIAMEYIGLLRQVGASIHPEITMTLPGVDPDMFGHSDIVAIEPSVLTVVDFKYGRLTVEPAGNYQAFIYAIMALRTVVANPAGIAWVRITIVQPRDLNPGPRIKELVIPVADLLAFEAALPAAVAATKVDNPTLRPGAWCQFCPAWGLCDGSNDILTMAANIMSIDVKQATSHQLAVIFEYKKTIETYLKRADGELKTRLLSGQTHQRVKLFTGTKHKQWKNEEAAAKEIGDKLGMPGLRPLSPAKIAMLGAAGKSLADRLSTTPPGNPALGMDGDRRAPYVVQSAKSLFANIPSAPPPPKK